MATQALTDREPERAALDRLVETVTAARSQVLVVRGDPGVGKTALLDYLSDRAAELRVVLVVGVQSEMELTFAALHQLCRPFLDRLPRLPAPQQKALRTALGLGTGPPPDRFLVGLAVLTLLSEVAAEQPLICVVDDEQWLDRASAQVLGIVARRLAADPVALVFAARTPSAHLAGLPVLDVAGLRPEDARTLLESALSGPLDAEVRDLIVTEARGNPLALLELPRSRTPAHLAGGFGLPSPGSVAGRLEDSFRQRLAALPESAQRLLQLAAADSSGDPGLVLRAAARLGIAIQSAQPAVEARLVEFGAQVHFRHPLVRSAAYASAPPPVRRELHRALAEATDPVSDPDRRAWHRAQSVSETDEDVAAELERSAARAQARGGLAAAAAFLERSVRLTADPGKRAGRALAAARATLAAGAFDRVEELLRIAESGPVTELAAAHADLVRAQAAFVSGLGGDAPPLLVKAAKRLESLDLALARETYLHAWEAASFAGRVAGAGSMEEIAYAVQALPPAADPRPIDQLLDAYALLITEDRSVAASALRRAARRFADEELSREEGLAFGFMAAALVWDDEAWHAIEGRNARLSRAAGALDQLPMALVAVAQSETRRGNFAAAATLIAETDQVREITGTRIAPYAALFLAAQRGDPEELAPHVETALATAEAEGQAAALTVVNWTTAILENGRGRPAEAFAAARRAIADGHVLVTMWTLPELIEAAARLGEDQVAAEALARLTTTTSSAGTDFGLGLEARSRALLAGPAADDLYREAVDRLDRAGLRTEAARAHLLYGEWLRGQARVAEAGAELRIAHDLLTGLGMKAFAERARRELLATGEAVRNRATSTGAPLTAREALIARLAADGLNNTEIGAQLFLSARTVEWHLRKVFSKLGVSSRRQLPGAL